MYYVPYTVTKGVATKEIPCITGKGAPTTATVGVVGLFYMDEDNGVVYKCVGAQDGAYTWEVMGGAETDILYYATLSAAIADINEGTTDNTTSRDNAKVEVFRSETGRLLVRLVGDVSEGSLITVNKDIDLVLGGNTLTFTSANSYLAFAADTDCTIDGLMDGSTIESAGVVEDTNGYRVIAFGGRALRILGGAYRFTGSVYQTVMLIRVDAGCERFEMRGGKLSAVNTIEAQKATKATRAIQSAATNTVIEDCEITVEGPATQTYMALGVDVKTLFKNTTITENGKTYANGLCAAGTLQINDCSIVNKAGLDCYAVEARGEASEVTITNTNIVADTSVAGRLGACSFAGSARMTACSVTAAYYAVHAGPTAKSVCVDRCSLDGYAAGIYAESPATTNVLVTDTEISGGCYTGEFEAEITPVAVVSIGGDDGCHNFAMNVDGCTINAEAGVKAVLIRSGDGEYGNALHISNTTINGEGAVSIEAVADGKAAHHLDVGIGTNITAEMIDHADCATFTNELYRKKHPDAELNGADFTALANYLNAKTAGV